MGYREEIERAIEKDRAKKREMSEEKKDYLKELYNKREQLKQERDQIDAEMRRIKDEIWEAVGEQIGYFPELGFQFLESPMPTVDWNAMERDGIDIERYKRKGGSIWLKTVKPKAKKSKRKKRTPRERGTNPRAKGTNPKALGTNPRALGTNPRALR